jgi:hypothetical protein
MGVEAWGIGMGDGGWGLYCGSVCGVVIGQLTLEAGKHGQVCAVQSRSEAKEEKGALRRHGPRWQVWITVLLLKFIRTWPPPRNNDEENMKRL